MKRMFKIYLDTSVISALFDERNPERMSSTSAFFRDIGNFELCISEVVVMEIARTPDLKLQNKMREISSKIPIISLTDDVEWLEGEYIHYGAVPDDYQEDAYHIAIAVINQMDYLLSWNFKHIVRVKTRDIVRMVNTIHGFRHVEIVTPAELL